MAKEIKLELVMTADEWCELVNAVGSKADLVENGDYGDPDPEDGYDPKAWAEELREVYRKVAAVLDKNKIVY